jgi:hypothetical protein
MCFHKVPCVRVSPDPIELRLVIRLCDPSSMNVLKSLDSPSLDECKVLEADATAGRLWHTV